MVALLAAFVVAWAWLAAPAAAQQLSAGERAELTARKEALFQQMLNDPANLDATFAYADVSAKLGDNEAAVSALERMLLFNPNLPRVDLELGTLYFRMGSFEIAKSYFNKALATNPPPAVRERVELYLAQIAVEQQPWRITGYAFAGAQYQSDANVAPGSPLIVSPVGPVLLSSEFVKTQDSNLFLTGAALFSYDLGDQNRDTVEVSGTGFGDRYFRVGRLNLDLGEVTGGVRFRFPDIGLAGVQSATVKPYVIANEVGLGGNQYFDTIGAGIEGTAALPWDLSGKAIFEFRHKTFSNAPDRPTSTGLNGNDALVTLVLSKPVTPNSVVSLEFDYLNQDTAFAFYSNNSYSISGNYRIRYDDPIGITRFPWETTLFASQLWANYESPDPCCVVNGGLEDRYDRHTRFGITQVLQTSEHIALVFQIQRDVIASNLPLYAYTSNSALFGPQFRF
jgi:hypothetical protein